MKNPTLEIDSGSDREKLAGGLIEHDAEGFEKLFWGYRSILRGVILRVVKDEFDADDVLQEIFVQLWTHAEYYSPGERKPLAWLITLARSRAIDRVRQRSAYLRATDRFEKEMQGPPRAQDGCRAGDETAFQGDLRDLVEGAMLRLPPPQKNVVERAFFDDLSQREIAAKLGIPLGTVKTRIQLGLRKLSSLLAVSRAEIF